MIYTSSSKQSQRKAISGVKTSLPEEVATLVASSRLTGRNYKIRILKVSSTFVFLGV